MRKSPRIILHIGAPKTGSTYLQRRFLNAPELLRKYGIYYPASKMAGNAKLLPVAIRKCATATFQRRFPEMNVLELKPSLIVSELLSDWNPDQETLVLSAENFRPRHATLLREILPTKIECTVVLFVRRQDTWLDSYFNQLIKSRDINEDMESFLSRVIHSEDELLCCPDWYVHYNTWVDMFGNCKIVFYDQVRTDLLSGFLAAAELNPIYKLPDIPPQQVSLSIYELAYLLEQERDIPFAEFARYRAAGHKASRILGYHETQSLLSPTDRKRLQERFESSNDRLINTLNRPECVEYLRIAPESPDYCDLALFYKTTEYAHFREIANSIYGEVMETEVSSATALPGNTEKNSEADSSRQASKADAILLGNQFLQSGHLEEAAQTFQQLTEEYPDHPRGFSGLAQVAQRRQDWNLSLQRWDDCLEKFPKQAQLWWYAGKGNALLQLGRIEEAEQVFLELSENHPEQVQGLAGLAQIAQRRQEWTTALARWEAVIAAFPQHANAHVQRGNVLIQLKHLEEAETALQQAAEKWPELPGPFAGLARIAQSRHEDKLAAERWQTAVARFPENLQFRTGHIRSLLKLRNFGRAHEAYADTTVHIQDAEFLSTLLAEIQAAEDSQIRRYPPLSWEHHACSQTISFVTVHFCDEIFHNLYCSKAIYEEHNELIVVDNRYNLYFSSLGAALNSGIEKATCELIAVIHEDVLLQPEWQSTLAASLAELEQHDPDWGLIGPVGWRDDGQVIGHWSDPIQYANHFHDIPYAEVGRLDEQLLLFRRCTGLRFDDQLPNIHALGQNIIQELRESGRRAYAVNAPTIHKYADKNGDLVRSVGDSSKIRRRDRRAARLMRECSNDYFFLRWGDRPCPPITPSVPITGLPQTPSALTPIVFTGRGGGGTRLISEIAQALGLHMGVSINQSGDSLDIVESIYKAVFYKYACSSPRQKALIPGMLAGAAEIVAKQVTPPCRYGFKVPELTLLIPELIEAFTGLRIVQLIRDPLDCTVRRLHPTSDINHELGQTVLPHAYRWVGRDLALAPDDHPLIHAAVSTAFQMELAAQNLEGLSSRQLYRVRFEDLLAAPERVAVSLSAWLGIEEAPPAGTSLPQPDPERARKQDIECPPEVLEEIKGILRKTREIYGYHDKT